MRLQRRHARNEGVGEGGGAFLGVRRSSLQGSRGPVGVGAGIREELFLQGSPPATGKASDIIFYRAKV